VEIAQWVTDRGGIVHRSDLLDRGVSAGALRAAVTAGVILRVRRYWLATPAAPPALVVAAGVTGVIACVSAARHRGWWMPDDVRGGIHVRVAPHARPPAGVTAHWGRPIVPTTPRVLVESIEDALNHVAACVPREAALAIWESAARIERLSPEGLRRVRWTTPGAHECAASITGLSDSGLETLFVVRLRPWGIPIRQQIVLAGKRVDALIGDRLVVQIDGFAFHSTAADRGRDVAHDRELSLRGYTVLRFTYAQVVHDWRSVERAIARAIAAGAHLAV
jgi:very-short-patch-repair endonuclease